MEPIPPTPDAAPPTPPVWPPKPPRSRAMRIALRSLAALGGALLLFGVWLVVLIRTTPGVDQLQRAQAVRPSIILSADGEVIGHFASGYEAPITLKQVAPDLISALIATEDHRFYEHHGIDPTRILGSAWRTLHGDLQGGSTLTQQLARNLFPQEIGNKVSINRKLREAITAIRLERSSSKDQILESYLNSAPFLYNVRGIEMASRTYFDRPAAELDTVQAATLVGMLKGTQRYNPVRNPERARDRRNVVLAQMVKAGKLTPARYELLRAEPLLLSFRRPEDSGLGQARHFVAYLRETLVDWADAHDVDLDSDGLVIRTTLDSKLQAIATEAVATQVATLQRLAGDEWRDPALRTGRLQAAPAAAAKPGKVAPPAAPFAYFWRANPALLNEVARSAPAYRAAREAGRPEAQALAEALADTETMARLCADKTRLSAGFVAMDPVTGAVKAWVGSPDFAREQFDHVAQAKRQPGSTFKPFVYGAALQKGISTEHSYLDDAVAIPLADGGTWAPTDGSGPSGERMTLREGLVQSKNTITAQVMQDVGPAAAASFAQAAGVRDSKLDLVPSLALGTSSVTLLEMADAYATLAALGERHPPLLITRISDRDGRVLEQFDSIPERVFDPALIAKLVDVMRGVLQTGTGTLARTEFGLRGDLAGKTGTTQNNTDGWFMLMSPNLVAGAWVGFNDARVTIRSNYWGQGGHNAIRVVGAFFREGQKGKLIDTQATFPQVVRDAPELLEPPTDERAPDAAAAALQGASAAAPGVLPALFQTAPAAPTAHDGLTDKQRRDQANGQ